uniref:E3 ubiquitin-protein ligase protein PFF1365c n=1 Tax=Diabrotica virgifera virgifera TaxID=50390 RepID=A0A6P7FGU3_DIAVI
MDSFYNPAPLEIAEIFRFQSKRQAKGESIQEYLHSLQKLAINCNFYTYLKSAIRNQFVFGLQSKSIQARLLETKGLDLNRVVEIAASMETSEKDSNQFSHNNNYNQASINVLNVKAKSSHKNTNTSKLNDNTVNNTETKNSSSPNDTSTMSSNRNRACYRCGVTSHLADKCNKKHLICNFCKKVGHIQNFF